MQHAFGQYNLLRPIWQKIVDLYRWLLSFFDDKKMSFIENNKILVATRIIVFLSLIPVSMLNFSGTMAPDVLFMRKKAEKLINLFNQNVAVSERWIGGFFIEALVKLSKIICGLLLTALLVLFDIVAIAIAVVLGCIFLVVAPFVNPADFCADFFKNICILLLVIPIASIVLFGIAFPLSFCFLITLAVLTAIVSSLMLALELIINTVIFLTQLIIETRFFPLLIGAIGFGVLSIQFYTKAYALSPNLNFSILLLATIGLTLGFANSVMTPTNSGHDQLSTKQRLLHIFGNLAIVLTLATLATFPLFLTLTLNATIVNVIVLITPIIVLGIMWVSPQMKLYRKKQTTDRVSYYTNSKKIRVLLAIGLGATMLTVSLLNLVPTFSWLQTLMIFTASLILGIGFGLAYLKNQSPMFTSRNLSLDLNMILVGEIGLTAVLLTMLHFVPASSIVFPWIVALSPVALFLLPILFKISAYYLMPSVDSVTLTDNTEKSSWLSHSRGTPKKAQVMLVASLKNPEPNNVVVTKLTNTNSGNQT